MMNIRTVTVEILRPGPRHNQLLSPLTPYLAVCGDSPADILTLPPHYEHAAFERRLQELRYEVASEDRGRLRGVLEETGTEMGQILGRIPGLAGALTTDPGPRETLTHLRIVLSASELALLPFELSKVPAGAGTPPDRWLGLSGVCITRHNRAVSTEGVHWPTEPRILFVSGPDVDEVFQAHLHALRKALRPWTDAPEKAKQGSGAPWLTVLRNASLRDVEEAMSQRPTHVHILAHGEEDLDDQYRRYGVAFEDGAISGDRLASALTHVGDSDEHIPSVVTLATCDTASEGSVIPPDASVAHALHEKGIPLVVASQFPLSFDGSVPFVRVFYEQQLWGAHPLVTMYELRTTLHANHSGDYHDWASLTVYEALPHDLADQLHDLSYWQSRRAHEAALKRLEGAVPELSMVKPAEEWNAAYEKTLAEVADMAGKLPDGGPYGSEGDSLRAAGLKRIAEVDWKLASATEHIELLDNCIRHMNQALAVYREMVAGFLGSDDDVVHKKANLHWALTQVLSLSLVLGGDFDHASWTTAKLSAETDLSHKTPGGRAWAHVSLMELWLLRLADRLLPEQERAEAAREAKNNARRIVNLTGPDAEQVTLTRRQVLRYLRWYGDSRFDETLDRLGLGSRPHWRESGGLLETAGEVVEILGGDQDDPDHQQLQPDHSSRDREAPKEDSGVSSPSEPVLLAGSEERGSTDPATVGDDAMFDIEMLPAGNGDALWIEYGSQEAPNRILVDSGRKDTAKHLIDRVAELGTPQFELFVMTHIDSDHIGGAIPFLQAPEMGATFNDIWFNGWKQLRGFLAVREGELFSKVLSDPGRGFPWNRAVTTSAHEIPQPIMVPEGGALPRVTLDGGMELTLLSPSPKDLHRLALDWQQALKELDPDRLLRARRPEPIDDLSAVRLEPLAEKKPNSDRSKANGSSIAFLAEYGGRSVLLTGDAHVGGLVKSIRALLREREMEGEKLSVDALKISHHGSANGLTKALLNLVECPRYLVSTNGDTHYHPDREAMARAVLWGGDEPTLHFNYRTDFNDMWGSPELTERYEYRAIFPEEGREGLRVSL